MPKGSTLAVTVDDISGKTPKQNGADWEKAPPGGGTLPMYKYFKKIVGKFRTSGRKRIQGFGIVKYPVTAKIPWTVTDAKKKNEAAP